jgi:phage FluMu protein Com
MPIEFRCEQCQRLLRVPDQNAGARARCPQCSHVQGVPSAGSDPTTEASDTEHDRAIPYAHSGGSPSDSSNPFAEHPQPKPFSDGNPYESPYSTGYQPTHMTREMARSRVMAPAIILMVFGILGTSVMAFVMVAGIMDVARNGADEDAIFGMFFCGFALLMELTVAIGSLRMLSLKNHGLALTAAILSLVCGLCSIITIPFSIWALVVLCDTNVKSQFS